MTIRKTAVSRRRAVTIIAGTAGFLINPALAGREGLRPFEWRGHALGAAARILLYASDRSAARRAIAQSRAEIDRLEQEFSLYRKGSALSRLNREGELAFPSLDMIALLQEAKRAGSRTSGAFDISVQPLWDVYARHFAAPGSGRSAPDTAAIERARAVVDYRSIEVDGRHIKIKPGMKLTLNGIAQGYITDRVGDMLRDQGWDHVLLDLGEIRSIGGQADGRPWRIGIGGATAAGEAGQIVKLENAAVATSASAGLQFDADGRFHHLMNPKSGFSDGHYNCVSVVAGRATIADAYSTALSVMPRDQARALMKHAAALGIKQVWAAQPGAPMARLDLKT